MSETLWLCLIIATSILSYEVGRMDAKDSLERFLSRLFGDNTWK